MFINELLSENIFRKYFKKHFLVCNLHLKNILWNIQKICSEKYFLNRKFHILEYMF